MGLLKKKKKEEAPAAEGQLKVVNQREPEQVKPEVKAEVKPAQFGHQSRDFKRKLNGI